MKEQCVPSQNIGTKNVENNICAQMVGNVYSTIGKRSTLFIYSLRPIFFVLFEKSNFLKEHHLLSCLPLKNV